MVKSKIVVPLSDREEPRKHPEPPIFHLRVSYNTDVSLLQMMEAIKDLLDRAEGDGEVMSAELEIGGNVYDVE